MQVEYSPSPTPPPPPPPFPFHSTVCQRYCSTRFFFPPHKTCDYNTSWQATSPFYYWFPNKQELARISHRSDCWPLQKSDLDSLVRQWLQISRHDLADDFCRSEHWTIETAEQCQGRVDAQSLRRALVHVEFLEGNKWAIAMMLAHKGASLNRIVNYKFS